MANSNMPLDLSTLTDDQRDDLDELVHDTASDLASNAINSNEQVDFLLTNGWTQDQIRDRITG